jgi:hypothetical protein
MAAGFQKMGTAELKLKGKMQETFWISQKRLDMEKRERA